MRARDIVASAARMLRSGEYASASHALAEAVRQGITPADARAWAEGRVTRRMAAALAAVARVSVPPGALTLHVWGGSEGEPVSVRVH